jgi:hypothetical protein
MVSRWVKMEEVLQQAPKTARKIGSGRRPTFPDHEEALYDLIMTRRNNGLVVTCGSIRKMMMDSLVNISSDSSTAKKFKASSGWLNGFTNRFHLSSRMFTSTTKINVNIKNRKNRKKIA